MERARTKGIIVTSVLYLIGAFFALFYPSYFRLFSVLYLVIAIGLFMLKPFVRYLALIVAVISASINIWLTVLVTRLYIYNPGEYKFVFFEWIMPAIFFLFPFYVIYYLLRPQTRALFEKGNNINNISKSPSD